VSTTFARGAEWIGEQRAPWFAFLHTYQVHEPYAPPPGYRERVGSPDTPSGSYDGEVRYTDEHLSRLLAELRRFGVLDETLIVVTSDHGEQFGEHGLRGHGNSLYDTLLHVPLLIRAPGLVPAGRRIDHPIGLIDLVPTVLELLEKRPSPWVQGVSLVPLLRGESLPPRQLFAENWGGVFAMRSTMGDEPKLMPQATAGEMYLTAGDPLEERNLAPSTAPATFEYAARRFAEHCTAPTPPPSPVQAPPLDPAVEEKLRALGYVR
jgi:arylsulfatase A-like enzyme